MLLPDLHIEIPLVLLLHSVILLHPRLSLLSLHLKLLVDECLPFIYNPMGVLGEVLVVTVFHPLDMGQLGLQILFPAVRGKLQGIVYFHYN